MNNLQCSISKITNHIMSNYKHEYSGIHYIATLEQDENPYIATFAWKFTKKNGFQIKLIMKEYIDHNELNDDLYYGGMTGYQVLFDGDIKRVYGYKQEAKNTFYTPYEPTFFPKINGIERFYTFKELNNHFKSVVPYLQIDTISERIKPMTVLRAYKEDHMCEMLTKFGASYLCANARAIKRLSKQKQKQFVKWLIDNSNYVKAKNPIYTFILFAIKNNESAEECEFRCYMINNQKFLKKYGYSYSFDEMKEISDYLLKQKSDVVTYRDYLNMSKEIGRNIEDRGVRFPRNLIEQHDYISKLITKEKNKVLNRKLKKIKKALEKFELKYRNLRIVIPSSQEELVSWGNKLHMCVGTYGYGEKMSKGKCIILGVYEGNNPVECCEIGKNDNEKSLHIVQLRGDHNQPSKHHNHAEKLISKFLRAYKPMNLIGGCI